MIGVFNRLQHVVCEVGTCTWKASHTEHIMVVPGDPSLKNERHHIDVVLCERHDREFQETGLVGIVTAYGDTIAESGC